MKIKRALLVVIILIVFGFSYWHMNTNFDVLSRYPYENENSRELIRRYLNDDEIRYIIEYDIAPAYFIDYITYKDFNIYHVSEYDKLKAVAWYLSDEEVVSFAEKLIAIDRFDEGLELVLNYDPQEILFWFENGDLYNPDAKIIYDPSDYDLVIGEDFTISTYAPKNLVESEFNGSEITLRRGALEAFAQMMEAMAQDTDITSFQITRSYVSYSKQEELYKDKEDQCDFDMPGHSEHQLGSAFDFYVANATLEDTAIYKWLRLHSEEYGFYFSYEDRNDHLRYRGDEQ